MVIQKVPVELACFLSHHEDHEGPEEKLSHPFFLVSVHFVVVRALL